MRLICSIENFNSIKVRLKHYEAMLSNMPYKFQFHKGTIKTVLLALLIKIVLYFNSIKVRLKLSPLHFCHCA